MNKFKELSEKLQSDDALHGVFYSEEEHAAVLKALEEAETLAMNAAERDAGWAYVREIGRALGHVAYSGVGIAGTAERVVAERDEARAELEVVSEEADEVPELRERLEASQALVRRIRTAIGAKGHESTDDAMARFRELDPYVHSAEVEAIRRKYDVACQAFCALVVELGTQAQALAKCRAAHALLEEYAGELRATGETCLRPEPGLRMLREALL